MTLTAIRKVFQGVANRRQTFRMFDRHAQRPDRWQNDDSALFTGEWFEVRQSEHDYMLNILPPLWMRPDMFAMREFLTGSVTSVFFSLSIDAVVRHFHGYCDLADSGSPECMKAAIVDRETRPVRVMTRDERLEHIWSSTADDYRGYAGERWPKQDRCKRTVLYYGRRRGPMLKLVDRLSDDEIAAKLPVHLRYFPEQIAA